MARLSADRSTRPHDDYPVGAVWPSSSTFLRCAAVRAFQNRCTLRSGISQVLDIACLVETHLEEGGIMIAGVDLEPPEHHVRIPGRERLVLAVILEGVDEDVVRLSRGQSFERPDAAFKTHQAHAVGKRLAHLCRIKLAAGVIDRDFEFKDAFRADVERAVGMPVADLEMISQPFLPAKPAGFLGGLVIDCLTRKMPFPKCDRKAACHG